MGKRCFAICLILAGTLTALGCNGLDTSWRSEKRQLPDDHPLKGIVESGEEAWRLVREAVPEEKLPGGAKAGHFDVLWEWRMELANISEKPIYVKAGFNLVTADETMRLAISMDSPDQKTLAIIKPDERKVFAGQGFIDKKNIPRIARGRGMIGTQGTQNKKGSGLERESPKHER